MNGIMGARLPYGATWFGGFEGFKDERVPEHLIVAMDMLSHEDARFWAMTDSSTPYRHIDVQRLADHFHGPYTAGQIRDAMRETIKDYPLCEDEERRHYEELERRLTQAETQRWEPEPANKFDFDDNTIFVTDENGGRHEHGIGTEERIRLTASLIKALPEWAEKRVEMMTGARLTHPYGRMENH